MGKLFMSALAVLAATASLAQADVLPSGLEIQYVSVPEACDAKVKKTDLLTMHYTGTRRRDQVRLLRRPQRAIPVPDWHWPGDPRVGRGHRGHVRGREEEADRAARAGLRRAGRRRRDSRRRHPPL